MPIASYLALTIVGDYTPEIRTVDGTRYYAFQSRSIPAAARARNAAVIATQPALTRFEEQFSGPFPFASDGIAVGGPRTASRTDEMESMIVWPASHVNGTSLLLHENSHQWWGDNVSEGNFDMAFFKDGMAVLSQQMDSARGAAQKAGGPNTRAGRAAFENSLVHAFNSLHAIGPSFWKLAPSNRSPATYLDPYAVYQRPAAAYIALRQILGPAGFDAVLEAIQRQYGGSSVTEPQLEVAFAAGLPNHSVACKTRLSQFFKQWFDTAHHGSKPQITGAGLHGSPFYSHGCTAAG